MDALEPPLSVERRDAARVFGRLLRDGGGKTGTGTGDWGFPGLAEADSAEDVFFRRDDEARRCRIRPIASLEGKIRHYQYDGALLVISCNSASSVRHRDEYYQWFVQGTAREWEANDGMSASQCIATSRYAVLAYAGTGGFGGKRVAHAVAARRVCTRRTGPCFGQGNHP